MTIPVVTSASTAERLYTAAQVAAEIAPWRALVVTGDIRAAQLICELQGPPPAHPGDAHWDAPSWSEAARAYHADAPVPASRHNLPTGWETMSVDALYAHLIRNRPTPKTTIDAIMIGVRARGPAALREPANVERLSRCDGEARAEIKRRIADSKKD